MRSRCPVVCLATSGVLLLAAAARGYGLRTPEGNLGVLDEEVLIGLAPFDGAWRVKAAEKAGYSLLFTSGQRTAKQGLAVFKEPRYLRYDAKAGRVVLTKDPKEATAWFLPIPPKPDAGGGESKPGFVLCARGYLAVDRANPVKRQLGGRERTAYRLTVTLLPHDKFVLVDG